MEVFFDIPIKNIAIITQMNIIYLKITFYFLFFLVFYTFLGYGVLLWMIIQLKRRFNPASKIYRSNKEAYPSVTFIVAAYNEEKWIASKVKNTIELDYPRDKLQLFFVTDGSTDQTPDIIKNFPTPTDVQLKLFHQPQRKGKIAAVNRIMKEVKTPIVIYTDANTHVNAKAVKRIVKHYQNPKVGAVAGEKRIRQDLRNEASSAGEGIYWRYESKLKEWDSELYSVVGAAGELFSIRTNLYEPPAPDTIIEDFYMTLQIAQRGFQVKYEPDAYALESSSASVEEELKRKIRIAAGGLQAIYRLRPLLNIFRYGILSFQYISHRVLRWTLAPLALPIIFLSNLALAYAIGGVYLFFLSAQVLFYLLALIGYLLEKKQLKIKAFFIPYYFCIMNYAVYRGFFRILLGNQSVMWERAKRADA